MLIFVFVIPGKLQSTVYTKVKSFNVYFNFWEWVLFNSLSAYVALYMKETLALNGLKLKFQKYIYCCYSTASLFQKHASRLSETDIKLNLKRRFSSTIMKKILLDFLFFISACYVLSKIQQLLLHSQLSNYRKAVICKSISN